MYCVSICGEKGKKAEVSAEGKEVLSQSLSDETASAVKSLVRLELEGALLRLGGRVRLPEWC